MLNIVRPGSVLTELLGQSLYEVRQELRLAIDDKYDADRI